MVFLGSEILALGDFFLGVYERRRDFLGSRKNGFFWVGKKGQRDFFGYAKKSSDFFFG